MAHPSPHLPSVAALVALVLSAVPVEAQSIGIFRWQQQPYCNVVTLTVTQIGSVYALEGFDDQCGAATRAAATGQAFPNPNGTIGFGLTIVTSPGGSPVHLDATVALATLGGTWQDSTGATGAWTFTPGAATPGAVRPIPRAAFPAGLSAGGSTITNLAAPVNGTDAATKAYVDTTSRAIASLTTNVSAYAARVGAGSVGDVAAGCLRFNGATSTQLQLDLPLPFGAVPTTVALKYIDTSTSALTLDVRAYVVQDGQDRQDSSAGSVNSTNGVGQGTRVQIIQIPAGQPAGATRGYYVIASAAPYASGDLGFCGAQVSYTLP